MGRSQGIIFGYGAIVPTEVYARLFPGSFSYQDSTLEWTPIDDSKLRTNVVRVFTSDGIPSKNVFVATPSSVDFGFEKGSVYTSSLQVDMNKINTEGNVLSPWLQQTFPGVAIGYMIYGYELD